VTHCFAAANDSGREPEGKSGGEAMNWAGVTGVAALLATSTIVQAQTSIERGDYLVNGLLTCGNCHTPRGPGGVFDMSKQLSGGPQTFDEHAFTVKGANITPDLETGIGKWSDDDIKRALQTGIRPNGIRLAPIMPYTFYKVFIPRDLNAVVAYLRSVPAVSNKVQLPSYKAELHTASVPGADKQMSEADLSDPSKLGFYLVTIAHCMECHTPIGANDRPDFQNLGKGGQEFRGPWGVVVSRNITSSKEKGIGAMTDDDVKRAITRGIRKDGTPLKGPMAFALYAKLTAGDLDAVVRYLRTIPPKE
jgi:mono/diheme cytochrome c family protein